MLTTLLLTTSLFMVDSVKHENEIKIDASMLHPRMREWAYPVNDVKVNADGVCLLWPGVDQKDVLYKVVLAKDRSFQQEVIVGAGQRWATFPVYQHLSLGKWYWKYAYKAEKSQDWTWSDVYSFAAIQSDKSVHSIATKDMLENLKNQAHPRLWSLNKNAHSFRTNNSNNPEAKAFVAAMRKQVGKPLPEEKPTRPRDTTDMNDLEKKQMIEFMYHGFGNKIANPVKDLCVAYYLTGDKSLMDEAIRLGVHVAKMDPNGLATRDDFNNGNIIEGLGTLYDLGHSFLTVEQKELLKKSISVRGALIYKHLPNRFELQMCDNHVWQHILRNFSIAAVAVAQDIPEANEWLTYVYDVWNSRFPVLSSTDGGWHEGNGYFRVHYKTLIYLPLLFGDLSGRNYYEEEWMHNLAYYMLYSYPPQSTSVSQGDMHENLSDIVRNQGLFADALASKINNPYLSWYASEVRRLYPVFFRANDDFMLFRLLNYKGSDIKSAISNPGDLPKSRDFRDVGLVAMHSDLVDMSKNVNVFFTSNPYGVAGHAHAAQNAITINYKGKKVFGGTGFYSNFSDAHNLLDYRSSRGHCTVLADSLSQRLGEDGYGWIPRFMSGNRIQYALGDASNAYGNVTTDFWLDRFDKIGLKADEKSGYGNPGVQKFRRHVLQLDSNYILLYDELEAEKPIKWTSQLHSPFQMVDVRQLSPSVQSFGLTQDFVNAQVTVYSSSATQENVHNRYNFPAKNWKGKTDDEGNIIHFSEQWHAGFTSVAQQKQRFLTVIQIHDKKGVAIKNLGIENKRQKIDIGGWLISVNLDVNDSAGLDIVSADQQTVFSYGDKTLKTKTGYIRHTRAGSSMLIENGKKQEVTDIAPTVISMDMGM